MELLFLSSKIQRFSSSLYPSTEKLQVYLAFGGGGKCLSIVSLKASPYRKPIKKTK